MRRLSVNVIVSKGCKKGGQRISKIENMFSIF